ncbi:MAG: hypothetical protein DHS20C15_07380 [Planctomycetota bacterium]|nr:MAG: hypothetical protein DHS20C15_07380 [Planctomycetota bacterium]
MALSDLRPVAAAVIVRAGRVLVQVRPDAGPWQGWWEFPGGGVEAGESWEACARREALEEVGLEVEVIERLDEVRWSPSGRGGVHVVFLLCSCAAQVEPTPELGQELAWVDAEGLRTRRFLPANEALLERLAERLS